MINHIEAPFLGPPDVEQIIAGLNELQPSAKQRKALLFEALYPSIEEARKRTVPQRAIIEFLKKKGLKLSPNTYRSMLEAESKRRKLTQASPPGRVGRYPARAPVRQVLAWHCSIFASQAQARGRHGKVLAVPASHQTKINL